MEGDAGQGGEELESLLEALASLIGRRLVGVGLLGDVVELIYDDCSVVRFSIARGGAEVAEMDREECLCLKHCMERHEPGSEEMGECMENCLEAGEEG